MKSLKNCLSLDMRLLVWNYNEINGDFWFRILGYGVAFYRTGLFSDRFFKKRQYFGYYITFLRP